MSATTTPQSTPARDLQPGQRIRFRKGYKARSPRIVVEVEEAVDYGTKGGSIFVFGRRIIRSATDRQLGSDHETVGRRRLFMFGPDDEVELVA